MKLVNIDCPGNKLDIAYSVSIKEFFARMILHVIVIGHQTQGPRQAMCWALIVWRQSVKCEQVAMQPYVNVISIIQTYEAEALAVLSTRLTTVDSPPSPCQMDLTYMPQLRSQMAALPSSDPRTTNDHALDGRPEQRVRI